jgi:hypothetical protein
MLIGYRLNAIWGDASSPQGRWGRPEPAMHYVLTGAPTVRGGFLFERYDGKLPNQTSPIINELRAF